MLVTCDICSGPLVVDADGQHATCQSCGMKHSIERVREKAQKAAGTDSSAKMDTQLTASEKKLPDNDEFRMSVFYVRNIWGRGVIVGGMVACGTIVKDEKLSILTAEGVWKNTIATMISSNPNQTDPPVRVTEGDQALLMLAGLKEGDVKDDTVLIGRPVNGRISNDVAGYNAEWELVKEETESDPSGVSISQTVLDKVGQFLKEKGTGADKRELEPIIDELEPQYEVAITYFEQHPMEDPAFHCIVGMGAYALAIYYVEYRFVLDDAEKYAMSARTHLKAYLDQFSSTLSGDELKSIKSAYDQSCEYAAYLAFYNNRYREVVPLLGDVYPTTTALALTGAALCLVADMDNSPETARAALSVFEQMDAAIKVPADSPYVEDVYYNAYTYYALMLAKNADRFPNAGFVKDIYKAIYCLQRGICLVHAENFIESLKKDIDEYSTYLAGNKP